MNKAVILIVALSASAANAEEAEFRCTSDLSGEEIQVFQNEDLSEARMIVQGAEGPASVAHGLDGVTFIHIKPDEVWTLALHFPTMTYELSTHGATAVEDHGHCEKG